MTFHFSGYTIDLGRRELRLEDEIVHVEPQVFDVLIYLIENRDRVVTKDEIFAAVWRGRIVSETTLSSRINAARRAIGDNGENQRLIRTIARKGVRFVGAVVEENSPKAPLTTARAADYLPQGALFEAVPRMGEASQVLQPSDKPSIAVLPFANLSSDP